jgi:hypothetical protein
MTAVTSTHQFGNGRGRPPGTVGSIPLSPDQPVPPSDQSIGHLVKEATTQLSVLIRSEVELARSEVVAEIRKGVRGSVYFVVALSILIFSLFFAFFALAETLDIWLPRSASFGIVFGAMLLAAALFGFLGFLRVRSIRKPERTINSVKDTAALVRRDRGDDDEE